MNNRGSGRPSQRIVGLDFLRVLAILLVTVQHLLSLSNHEEYIRIAGFPMGKVGVAMLLAISGLLAVRTSRPPLEWLGQRLARLMPAYWMVTIASLVMAAVIGHKEIDAGQVVSQLLGVGLFTHDREDLVNSPTWFISLILVCYVASTLARLSRRPGNMILLQFAVLAGIVVLDFDSCQLARGLSFLTAAYVWLQASPAKRRWNAIGAIAVLSLMGMTLDAEFAYAAIALAGVEISCLATSVPHLARQLAAYSYEYYLVHSIAFVAAFKGLPGAPLVACVAGVIGALVAAMLLKHSVDQALAVANKWWKRWQGSTYRWNAIPNDSEA